MKFNDFNQIHQKCRKLIIAEIFSKNSLRQNFKVKSNNLKKLNSDALNLINKFDSILVKHIYREQNKRADQLANMALDK